ncbi:MAG TPA: phage baseplate assembly protein V [Kutzneria sp.]|nr:phage baseplate assembly protein V [Kutzneria sp.]
MMPGGLLGQSTALVWPTVKIGAVLGMPLSPTVQSQLVRAVVDTHLHLPDMFELTFLDEAGTVTDDAGLDIGTAVEILAGDATSTTTTSLLKGEVTAIEAICADAVIYTVIRGYEKAHRLQRARRTRTFLNMKDSDIARQVASHAGLEPGTIDESSTTHTHIAQVAQTDWEFLVARAREIGYETGVVGGEFFFRKASGQPSGGGGLLDTLASAVGIGAGPTLTFKDNLITFLPRISAANLTPDVEVRVWDAKSARVAVGSASASTGTATIDGEEPAQLANSFTDGLLPPLPHLPALPPIPGLPRIDFGSSPSNTAYVVVDRPLAIGSDADSAAEEAAKGLADHISSTFAEAEGTAVGDPRIQAGVKVTVAAVPKQFAGSWTVTNAKHTFDPADGGYHTKFYVSGRQDRSLFKLASGAAQPHSGLAGLVCGVVTNAKDPDNKGKVKVALPWLSPNYESDWARVVQLGAGRRSGLVFVPEVGDEVLLGFEFGDPRRPYVIGGLTNDNSSYEPLSSAVNGSGAVVKRAITSPAGNGLLLQDELPPGPPGAAPPTTSSITLGTGDGNLGLAIDQVGGTVTLTCKPAPPASRTPAGTLTIDCSGAGKIEIKAGAGGLKLTSDGQLELSGQAGVKISSPALVEVSGQMIKLN